MTVEIAFALLSACVLAALVFAVTTSPVLLFDLPPRVTDTWLMAGAGLSLGAAAWRVIHVLLRFERGRRLGR